MVSFFDLLKNRRSIRKYEPREVEQDKILKITKAALMSPASKRSNPWEFIVIQDRNTLLKLSESRPYGSQMLKEAPLAIVVIADTTKSDVWIEDASIAAIIIQLQAQDLGLGSCWVQVYNRQKNEQTTTEEYIKALLNIPTHFGVLCIMSIGYPDEKRKPFEEEKLADDKIHFENFKIK
ncbi:MAG: nitroreductase family protein [Paludibacter sp.]|nr:nitroreductase family protein [Paludibacter sp.]